MRSLLDKIEADAAKKLVLPPGVHPTQELARYRNFLKIQSHRLKILHRGGSGGREICHARAVILDAVLSHLFEALRGRSSETGRSKWTPIALVGIGGYGRAELNPHSDVDIMFLHGGRNSVGASAHPCLALISAGILADIGLKIGHSTRNPADCVQVAKTDMKAKTSLIEARLIAGDRDLFDRFQVLLRGKCILGHEDSYIAARLADQQGRQAKFGNSPLMQEPNIKNGCGGLRDYQNLLWMTYVKYGARTTEELVRKDLVSAAEARELEAAYDFLLRARTELHYQVSRPLDVLNKNLLPKVANFLGYKHRSAWVRLEDFMRDYYTHARNVYLITRMIEDRLALAPPKSRAIPSWTNLFKKRAAAAPVVDGFQFCDSRIVAAHPKIFDDSPPRLMRAFRHAQHHGLTLHPDLAQLIRRKLELVNRAFQNDPRVRATFLEILGRRGNVGATLRAMHEVGLLGKYLPEFGKLTNLVQHEFYHQYAADEHTLVCLEKLDRVWESQSGPLARYNEMLHSLERPFVLSLALLLHDTGKACGTGDHSEAGARLASKVARRLDLDARSAGASQFLVRHHLAMARISQRRDLNDIAVIEQFAALVKSEENLQMLTLLTLADTLGTSEKLWNGFKDTLLMTLFCLTRDSLKGSSVTTSGEEERSLLADQVAPLLPKHISREELHAHFTNLPPRYFQTANAREILQDIELAHRFFGQQVDGDFANSREALHPIIAWHSDSDRGFTEVKLCTWDRPRLFSRMAGACSAAGMNIINAQIFSRIDGIALDTFYVTDARTGGLPDQDARQKFERVLNRALEKPNADLHHQIARIQVGHSLYQSLEGERIPIRIRFDNDSSPDRTIIEVETEDRVGLLYVVTQAMSDLGLDISLARISTEKGAAVDAFYVTHPKYGKLANVNLQHRIREKIAGAIVALESLGASV